MRFLWILGVMVLASPAPAFVTFTGEVVDAPGNVGSLNSLALDTQGQPHVSYLDATNSTVKYATRTGVTWTVETVGTGVFSSSSLALDASGKPHISFRASLGDLLYAQKGADGAWLFEVVDAGAGLYSSLALDADGSPHISYSASGDFRYARKNKKGKWTKETVVAGDMEDLHTSIALDNGGNPSISFVDRIAEHLRLASRVNDAWILEDVDTGYRIEERTSLALDAQGVPHIAYYNLDTPNLDLKYATRSADGTWALETPDAEGDVGWYCSLALDQDQHPRISYYDDTNGKLKYASRIGSTWYVQVVHENMEDMGQHTSLALDGQGNPRITYSDVTNLNLRYASGTLPVLDPNQSFFVPQAGLSPLAPLEGNAALRYFRVCPNNDQGSSLPLNARVKVVLRDTNGNPMPGAASDIAIRFNGGTFEQGYDDIYADEIIANFQFNQLANCPDVFKIVADRDTDGTGATFITFAGLNGIRDASRKWGGYESDIPLYALGSRISGRHTTGAPAGSLRLDFRNFDSEGGLGTEPDEGEWVSALDVDAMRTDITTGPYHFKRDFDRDDVNYLSDYDMVGAHANHRCNVPSP